MSILRTLLAAASGAALLAPAMTIAGSGRGERTAMQTLSFIRLASNAGVHITPDLDAMAEEIENHDCKVTAAASTMLPTERRHLAKAYAKDFCKPWHEFWEDVLDVCDGDSPPAWCDDEALGLKELDLDGYFATLTTAITGAASGLERNNILDTVLGAFSAHVIGDFGREPPDRWATAVTSAYLRSASASEAISLAKRLQGTWVGLTPGVVRTYHEYSEHNTTMSTEQRTELDALLLKRFSR